MAIAEFAKGGGAEHCKECAASQEAFIRREWCALHNPNVTAREKRVIEAFISRVMARTLRVGDEPLGKILHRQKQKMYEPYREVGSAVRGREAPYQEKSR